MPGTNFDVLFFSEHPVCIYYEEKGSVFGMAE
jgi:hypothetical protein